jgi:WD40 repeat protein
MERYQGRLNALAALPGRVVGGGDDGRVWIWDLVSGKVVASFSGHDSWLTSLTALPSGHLISSGTDGRLSVWAPEGQNLRLLSVVACSVRALSAGQTREGNGCLAIAHADTGVSYWTLSVPE